MTFLAPGIATELDAKLTDLWLRRNEAHHELKELSISPTEADVDAYVALSPSERGRANVRWILMGLVEPPAGIQVMMSALVNAATK